MQQYTHGHPLAMVCVAAPEDAALLGQWESHLQPLEQAGLISFWSERHLAPGTDRVQAFQHQFEAADLVLLLLSADFFSSSDCLAMMEQALERSQTGTTRVIPLLLRPVAWQESPLAEFTPWPSKRVPITQWGDQDAAWDACVLDLRRLLGRRVSLPLPAGPTDKHIDPDWERMLRRLRRSYKELLDQSLHGIAWVELGLSTRPDVVSNVTTHLFRLPQGEERLLTPGTSVLEVYDEAEGELLILGAPGAGKSTLLLDLALRLVGRAQASEIEQLPVILRLSSWAVGRPPLADWMIEQLHQTYAVPSKLSERWVTQGRLLPLLDGLDEVEESARPACIEAINTYHRTHLIPLVVCSRHADYEVAARRKRLDLQSAVLVQPLSDEQIEAYLQRAGPSFAEIRATLHQTPALWKLATTPLMLSVLLLTYQGASTQPLLQSETDLEQQVWTDYIARQVKEKGDDLRYPLERTRTFLAILAHQMHLHQQSIFYTEYLQADWLTLDQQRTLIGLAIRLPAAVIGVCVCLLVSLFLDISPLLLQMGLLGGFVGVCLSQQVMAGPARPTHRFFNKKLIAASLAVLPGLLLAASYGLFFAFGPPYLSFFWSSLSDQVRDSSLFGLGSGLSFWIFQKLLHRTPGRNVSKNARGLWGVAPRSVWQAAAVLGVGIGLSAGLSYWLILGLNAWLNTERMSRLIPTLHNRLIAGLIYGLGSSELRYGLVYGLSISIMMVLLHAILAGSLGPLHFAERIRWTGQGLLQQGHLRTSLCIAGALFLCFGLSNGLYYGLIDGLYYGLIDGLHYGLGVGLSIMLRDGLSEGLSYGLGIGLSFGLSYWIVFGLYQGMQQEHLEDQGRQQFNQGIHLSLRNGLLLSLISALIISAIGGLSEGLSYELNIGLRSWLSYGLSIGLSYGLSNLWIWLLTSMVVIWALSGGLTVLRHYVIRWLLARHRIFPWRAQAFLDDATTRILLRRVGGGYSFIHRRLQDYFANAAVSPVEEISKEIETEEA
jgi:hypothetical protein